MIKETMTKEERILAAINLEPYDRVPVSPLLNFEYSFRHKGGTVADAYNPLLVEEGFQATLDLFDEVGGWDAIGLNFSMPITPKALFLLGAFYAGPMKYPTADSRLNVEASPQFEEREIMKAEDYDEIANLGWQGFVEKYYTRFIPGLTESVSLLPEGTQAAQAKILTDRYIRFRDTWHKRGVPVTAGYLLTDPQMLLSLLRSITQFTLDVHRRPEKVKAALDAMIDDFIRDPIESMRLAGPPSPTKIPGIMISCERGSASYYNLAIFEQFVWPYIKKEVEAWWEAGYVTTLHFDTDWTKNLPYLLELPRKSCIVELDSTTDIFKAKEILKDHMCIMGDVPPAISSHGTTEEMETYCKKLIDIVGKDTGFILSTGCAVPPDTKFENFKAMIDTAKNHPPPRS
jgi:hypothetical protein